MSEKGEKIYYIVNWPYHEHREMPRRAKWIKAKVDFEGDDWVLLTAHEHCVEALAVWEVVRGLAVQSPCRGLLLRDGHRTAPHTISSIAAKSRLPEATIARGLKVLVEVVGWIQIADGDDYATLSKSLWGNIFGSAVNPGNPRGKSGKRRDGSAEKPRESRGKSGKKRGSGAVNPENTAPTVHKITSPHPTSPTTKENITSPARAREAASGDAPPPGTADAPPGEVSLELLPGEVGGEGENDGEWENGELEQVFELLGCAPRADVLMAIRRANPLRVIGHALDIRDARKPPKKPAVALLWRLEHKQPSMRHYPDAAKRQRRRWAGRPP